MEPETSAFVPSSAVKGLVSENFSQYLSDKQAALVMFYDPGNISCRQAKPHLNTVARKLQGEEDMAFATVDCTKEPGLCDMEGVDSYPAFKIYSGGLYQSHVLGVATCATLMTKLKEAVPTTLNTGRESGGSKQHPVTVIQPGGGRLGYVDNQANDRAKKASRK